ncbi:diaminobutyrate acetyltransferase [Stappia sp.]|jgi:L-2,4-diaminobutyric acid acetyltransferase|uniref:diaminobutyrate acetyltransferase n=1 Tax=Stappia sp. TaxID=1870903 RepID=UPI003A9A45AB
MTLTKVSKDTPTGDDITLRKPRAEDGAAIWRLIGSCAPLDENSMYCNLLQCDHFADTCVLAERASDGEVLGWVSGYLLPDDPETLFIWQVAVSDAAKGKGLAKRLLAEALDRDACSDVRRMKTTITADNAASWGLFTSFARRQGGVLDREPHFRKDAHFDGEHATEHMVTIRFAEAVKKAA